MGSVGMKCTASSCKMELGLSIQIRRDKKPRVSYFTPVPRLALRVWGGTT